VEVARDTARLSLGDVVAVVGDTRALALAAQIFGSSSATSITRDRGALDFRRIFVSSREAAGKTIRELDLQNRFGAMITRVKRGDEDHVAAPELRLQRGDRVRVVARPGDMAAITRFFGDSIRSTGEADFGSAAIGMVLGVLLGMLPITLPGGTVLRLGLAGGPLVVALALGRLERTGGITWTMPVSANLTLREMGLLFFLAAVGTRSGFAFVSAVKANGAQMLLAGAVTTVGVALLTLYLGRRLLGLPFDALMGLTSGVHTQPACLSYAVNTSKSDAPNVAYASVFPAAMIAKVILAQLLLTLLMKG
jgi:putative transport protein